MQNGPECLPKHHGPGPEGVMPKAFPVIDPEPLAFPVPLRYRSGKGQTVTLHLSHHPFAKTRSNPTKIHTSG